MKLTKEEKAARRAAFQAMSLQKKLEHIYFYYKWPILLGLIAVLILGSTLRRQLSKKEPVLYLALANVTVGEDMETALTEGFLHYLDADMKKQEVYLYRDLYLSDNAAVVNHEYAYASRMKLMGAVSAQKLDLVLMNREAYDLLSRSGYLLDLSPSLFSDMPGLYERLLPFLVANEVILSDNGIEYLLGEAETHETESKTEQNALDVSCLPPFERAGFPDTVFLSVIANSDRLHGCRQYMDFLSSDP